MIRPLKKTCWSSFLLLIISKTRKDKKFSCEKILSLLENVSLKKQFLRDLYVHKIPNKIQFSLAWIIPWEACLKWHRARNTHVKGSDSLNVSQFPNISTTPQKVYSDFGGNICRFCSGAKDHCTNIFGIGGERKKISDKASEVLNISIREEDGLPYTICRPCEGALNRFSEFRKMVIDTQNHLKSKVITKRCKSSNLLLLSQRKIASDEMKPT